MEEYREYFDTNRVLWNAKTPVHIDSKFYDMDSFKAGKSSLNKIELDILPDLKEKTLLHPQCHFGQDTISLERLGAQVTGVDFSDAAVARAQSIAKELGSKARFFCSNVYEMDKHLDQQFDYVFCSYGVMTWLPDLDLWAKQIAKRLKRGGQFIFVEFHPLLYMYDWDVNQLAYNYFNSNGVQEETVKGTYADTGADIELKEYFWQHSLSELFTALIKNGLRIDHFAEYDYSPYDIFGQREQREQREFVFKHNNIIPPHVFSLKATRI